MPRPEKKTKGSESLRQEITVAAKELFVRKGYANVSMRKIAEKTGYSPTAIYLHFRDKGDLLHQICEQAFADLARNIRAIQNLSDGPLEKLRSGMREYIHFGLKHPSEYELVFITPLKENTKGEFASSNGKAAFETMTGVVGECVAAKLLKSDDVELISQTLWAGIHGVTALLISHKGFPFVDRGKLIDNTIDTLIAGIKA